LSFKIFFPRLLSCHSYIDCFNFFFQECRLQKIDIQTNSIQEMCNIMSIDLKKALKDVHPSYAELGRGKPMSISNDSLDRLSEKVHALNHEKKQRLWKVRISFKLVISLKHRSAYILLKYVQSHVFPIFFPDVNHSSH